MSPLIQKWIDARKAASKAWDLVEKCLEIATEKAELPENLRPATAADCAKVGNIIWYKDHYDGPYWKMVDEVDHYGDKWKAYTAHDGCRYGLEGAFVEVTKRNRNGTT